MATYIRVASLKPQQTGTANRIMVVWIGPDNIQREYAVNQNTLKGFKTAAELKAAVDQFTQNNFGYILNDVWFHLNRDGSWAVSVGANPPLAWPEDEAMAL